MVASKWKPQLRLGYEVVVGGVRECLDQESQQVLLRHGSHSVQWSVGDSCDLIGCCPCQCEPSWVVMASRMRSELVRWLVGVSVAGVGQRAVLAARDADDAEAAGTRVAGKSAEVPWVADR